MEFDWVRRMIIFPRARPDAPRMRQFPGDTHSQSQQCIMVVYAIVAGSVKNTKDGFPPSEPAAPIGRTCPLAVTMLRGTTQYCCTVLDLASAR